LGKKEGKIRGGKSRTYCAKNIDLRGYEDSKKKKEPLKGAGMQTKEREDVNGGGEGGRKGQERGGMEPGSKKMGGSKRNLIRE